MNRWWRHLAGLPVQLLGIVLASVLVLLIAVAFGGISIHNQEMRGLVGDRDERATHIAARLLSERLSHRATVLAVLAEQVVEDFPPDDVLTANPALLGLFDNGFMLLDAAGEVVWQHQSGLNWQPGALDLTDGAVVLSHVDSPSVLVAAAALPDGRQLLGAFSPGSVEIGEILAPLRTSTYTEVLLVSDDGHVIFSAGATLIPEAANTLPGVSLALNGESGALYTSGDDGQERIVTFSPIPAAGWALVVQEPWEQVTSVTLRLSENTLLVVLPIAIFAMMALFFGIWRIVRPLQRLEHRASRLAWGDYAAIREPVGGIVEIDDLQQALIRLAHRVQQAENARQSYIGAMTRGQEEERARLARELHDETVQSLIVLGQRIQMAERQLTTSPDKARATLGVLRDLVNTVLDDVRRIIRDMRPSYLEDLGLIPALRALCQDVERHHGLAATFSGDEPDRRFSPDVEVALYRVAQEALNNVARHAHASRVDVRLTVGDEVVLQITDDGQGFEVPSRPDDFAASGHFGLMTIAERLRLIGGALQIDSTPGQGTTVTVRLEAVPGPA